MATADNTTNLKRDNTTDGVNASIETLPASTPSTLGYDESTFVENKWGYRIANSSINPSLITTNYFPFASGSTILENTTSTNEDKATVSFASKINYNLPAGSYATELIMNATANPIVYDINYYNGYDTTSTGIVATQTSTTSSASSIILNPTYTSGTPPTRNTYTLAGWCVDNTNRSAVSVNTTTEAVFNSTNTKVTAYNNPATVCNGTMYQTGDYLPLTPNDTNNINFYAVWTPTTFDQAYAANNKSKATEAGLQYYKMQDMNASICDAVTPNQNTILVDYRKNVPDYDGTTTTGMQNGTAYHVGKLEDGRCWMLDNLYLNLNNQNVVNDLKGIGVTGANTNAATAAINALKNGGGTDSNGLAHQALSYTNWTTANSVTQPMVNRSGVCDPDKNLSYRCTSPWQSNSYDINTVIDKYDSNSDFVADTTYNIGLGDYKIGAYYNYCATSAGSYCYTGSHTDTNNVTYDICPVGWRLPRSGTVAYPTSGYDEFRYFYDVVKGNYPTTFATSTSPYSFQTMLSTALSGMYDSGTAYRVGIYNIIISSSYYASSKMYTAVTAPLWIVTNDTSTSRSIGHSVRCIAQN